MKSQVTQILADAFEFNKSANYVIHPKRRNRKARISLMKYAFEMAKLKGKVYWEKNEAAALLMDSSKSGNFLKHTFLDIKLAIQVIGISRVLSIMKREAYIKKHHPKEAFFYLWFLGVPKKLQGKGIGSELLQTIISDANKENRAIYLETSMPENVHLYERYGFEIYHTWDSNEAEFTVWFMQKRSN